MALFFGRKSDDWGRMFSYNEWIPKLFPKISEFDVLRESAMEYYDRIKVFIRFSFHLDLLSQIYSYVIFYFVSIRILLTSNIKRSIRNMNDTFWICALRKLRKEKMIQNQHIAVVKFLTIKNRHQIS